ncbi:MAG: hypothetical protein KDB27_05700 [Planctomycetales bacterium]|nr:hypothetical protein [Planctomycetales bacterium]
MEVLKRLIASSVSVLVQSLPSASVRDYLLRHFLFFTCLYLVCVGCFYCCFNGTAETLGSIKAESRLWFMLLVHGTGVWCVHVCIAGLSSPVWRAGPFLTAAVGAVSFVACAFAFRLTVDNAHDSIAGPVSWTSGYVRFSICIVGSVVAVEVLAQITRIKPNHMPAKYRQSVA